MLGFTPRADVQATTQPQRDFFPNQNSYKILKRPPRLEAEIAKFTPGRTINTVLPDFYPRDTKISRSDATNTDAKPHAVENAKCGEWRSANASPVSILS